MLSTSKGVIKYNKVALEEYIKFVNIALMSRAPALGPRKEGKVEGS